ncbi:restriction endonuclease subunit S [Flavivirga jejuensis]|uniref:Restriction endonuclease subunit S n=1 Tax=Flavivirga jejuensis TaxID=870487 RepID=A0ABT8WVF5_9FLAO|nr:restriction endonuclease subunit S [Flavivirga jejuensis]MDO5977084.1 restriction endonuclease subunit S [Flavivirga jejuensis]
MGNWKNTKLSSVLTRNDRFEERCPEKDYVFSGIYSFSKGILIRESVKGDTFKLKRIQRIFKGDFIYSKIMAWEGAFTIAPEEAHNTVMSGAFVSYTTNEQLLIPEFLDYYFKISNVWKEVGSASSGTNMRRRTLHPKQFENVEILLPSIRVQREIVNNLNDIVTDLNIGRNLLENNKKLISKLRQSILKDTVQGKLTAEWRQKNSNIELESATELIKRIKKEKELLIAEKKLKKTKENGIISEDEYKVDFPSSWELIKAVDIGFVTKLAGFEYTKYINLKDEGEVPVIRAQNVKPNRIDETNLKYIDLETSKLLHRCELVKESLLITFIGAGIGDVAIFKKKERWHLAPNVAKLEPFNNLSQKIEIDYLQYYLQSPIGRSELFKHIKATAQPSLSMGTIRDVIFCLPPHEEQKIIVSKVNELMSYCDQLEKQVEESKLQAEQLMQAVLQEVFNPKQKENSEDVVEVLFPDLETFAEVANLQQAMIIQKTELGLGSGRGKVYAQKTSANLKNIFGVDIPYTFEKSHHGEFSYQLSNDLDNNPYLRKVKTEVGEIYEVKNNKQQEVLNALNKPENASFIESIDELLRVYQNDLIKGSTDRIELLNTVWRAIKDTKSLIGNVVYKYLEEWEIKQGAYKTKADKFTKPETFAMITLIKDLGWDKKTQHN